MICNCISNIFKEYVFICNKIKINKSLDIFSTLLYLVKIYMNNFANRRICQVRNAHRTRYHFKSINAISETWNNILIFRTIYLLQFEIKITHDHAQTKKNTNYILFHEPNPKVFRIPNPPSHLTVSEQMQTNATYGDYFRKRHVCDSQTCTCVYSKNQNTRVVRQCMHTNSLFCESSVL